MKRLSQVLLLLGFGFLLFLVWTVGPDELWHQVRALGWGVLPIVVCEGVANLAHTVAWRHCINGNRSSITLFRLFRMAMAGFAINYLTPSASMGGEVSRATLLASHQKGTEAVSSVLLDKLMTAVAHLALAVGGSLFLVWRVHLPIQLWVAMIVTTGLITGGITGFLLLQRYGKLGGVFRWLVSHRLGGPSLERAARRVSEVDEVLRQFYRRHPWDLVLSALWHLLGHSAALAQAWVFLFSLGEPAPLTTVAAAGFLSLWFDLLTFVVPLNLGTLEGSRIVVFKALGCPTLLGMTYGIAVRIAQLFWACFGLISYSLFSVQRSGTSSDSPRSIAGDRRASDPEP